MSLLPDTNDDQEVLNGGANVDSATEAKDAPDAQTSACKDAASSPSPNAKQSNSDRSRLLYRREYVSLDYEVSYSEDLGATRVPSQSPTQAIVVTETFHTNQSRDSRRPENEKGLPPRVISTRPTTIEIKSQAVIHALRTVSGYYPGVSLTGDTVRLYEPFPFLYHHRKELQEYADQYSQESSAHEDCREDQRVAADIGLLLDVFEEICGQDVRDELERHTQPVPTCTHNMMWMLYKPGTDTYKDRREDGVYQGHVVHELEFTYIDKKAGEYSLLTWRMQGDDASIGASEPESSTTLPFAGEWDIAGLPWIPCEFMRLKKNRTTDEQRRKELVQRGKKYCSLLNGQQFVSFDGYCSDRPRLAYRGRAIVDMWRYYSEVKAPLLTKDVDTLSAVVPRCDCPHCSDVQMMWSERRIHFAGYGGSIRGEGERMTDRMLFLCADFIPAYILKHRKWILLEVEGFSWPQFTSNLIETLVIPSATRKLLQSLCLKFTSKSTWSADFIEGKGEGNIVLLHGKPGVGKTYTAECVAEETQRPLMSLTCADIGTVPEIVEEKLLYWFELAKAWGAILLLDEADVFLERRSSSDLVRNNLVAIFLRTLEYYNGILFLTTNRVGTFDEAFLSRIDVPIYFRALTNDQRTQIWSSFIRKLEEEKRGKIRVDANVKYYIKEDRDLLGLEMNGREIRSGFQTAVALAEIEGLGKSEGEVVVREDHIAKVVEMSKEFKRYLKDLHQQSPGDMAANLGHRADSPSRSTVGFGAARPF